MICSRMLHLLCALTAAGLAPSAARAQLPYANPVLGDARRVTQPVADPFVLKWNGEYYLYATGEPIRAYHSTDLVRWKPLGGVLSPSKDARAWNQTEVWAPEVVYRQGKFHLYYTATRRSPDWRVSEAERRVGVAVADRPQGPFVDSGQPVSKGWAIDGTVFTDPDGGQEYLFYSYLFEPKLPGAGIVVDRLLDWRTAAGRPALVTRGTDAWEDKDGDPLNGSLRYTNEAPVVVKRLGRYVMMYSGGSWDRATYAVAHASADRIVPGSLAGPGWRKSGPPFLTSTPLVEGSGHHALVKAPNNLDDICVYHARAVPFADPGDRLPFVARLFWNHDRPWMPAPTRAEQAPPDRPLFLDLFDRTAGALGGKLWKAEAGGWSVADGEARQSKGEGNARAEPRLPLLLNYVFEANLRFATGSGGSGAIGVAAFDAGPENRVEVMLDARRHALISSGRLAGKAIPEVSTRLPAGFVPEAYHQLLIVKNAGRLQVLLDGVKLQARRLPLGAGSVALQTREARAHFDGVAVSAGFEDDFLPARESCTNLECLGWTAEGKSFKLAAGRLQQSDAGAEQALALKGDLASDYELTASLRWGKANTPAARAGIVAASTVKGELVLAGFDRNIWPFARLHLQRMVAGKSQEDFTVGLPRGFDYAAPHTLRVVKQGSAFTLFLDGREAIAARFPVGPARAGLWTAAADATFLGVAWKRLGTPQNYVLNPSFESEQWDGARATRDNPWQLEGAARPSDCCAHSGSRRLLVIGGPGSAEQWVGELPAGRYTLRAYAQASAGAEAQLAARVAGSSEVRARSSSPAWSRLSLDLMVPRNGRLEISFSGRMPKGAAAWAALDDVYLYRN